MNYSVYKRKPYTRKYSVRAEYTHMHLISKYGNTTKAAVLVVK